MEYLELCSSWIFQTSGGASMLTVQTQTDRHHRTMHYFRSQIWELSVQFSRKQWGQALLCKGHIGRGSSRSLFNLSVPHAKHNTANSIRSILSEEHSLRQVIWALISAWISSSTKTPIPEPKMFLPYSLLPRDSTPSVFQPFHCWTVKSSWLQEILMGVNTAQAFRCASNLVCSAFSRSQRCWNRETGLLCVFMIVTIQDERWHISYTLESHLIL